MSTTAFPSTTRRTIVLSLAGSAFAAGLLSVAETRKTRRNASAAPRIFGKKAQMAQASFEQWRSEVGSLFFASTEAGPVALKLVSVTALPIVGIRPSTLRAQPFEAKFKPEGSVGLPAGDRLYPVRHVGHGTFHLYFSSAGEALKALFN